MVSIVNVQDIEPRVQYTAIAAQTAFTYPFPIFEDDNLVVYDNDTLQALSTHYTVSGAGNDNGGTVTFTSGRTAGHIITIYRDIAIERLTDFATNGPLASATFNDELDRITLVLQQLESRIGRALRLANVAGVASSSLELSPLANWLSKYVFIGATGVPEPAENIVTTTLSQSIIGALLYPQTPAEISAGVTPTSFQYEFGNLRRQASGDGTTDDTAQITNSISAASDGYSISVPNGGHFLYSSLTLAKSITFQGDGWSTTVQDVFGSGFTAGTTGSVLRSSVTSGSAITATTIGKAPRFKNIALLGPGSGTSIGVTFGSAASYQVWGKWDDVLVANFFSGLVFSNVEDYEFSSLRIRGCTTGLTIQDGGAGEANTNQNTFVQLEIQQCGTGLLITEGSTNLISGGLIQGNTIGVKIAPSLNGVVDNIVFDSVWFEDNTTVIALDITNGSINGLTFRNCKFSGSGNLFSLTNPNNRGVNWLTFINCHGSGMTVDLSPGASIGPCYTRVAGFGNRFSSFVPSNADIVDDVFEVTSSAYTPADTTPSVLGGSFLSVTNAGPVTITNLDDGYERQEVMLLFTDANTTIQDGTNFQLAGGANFVSSANDTLTVVKSGTVWYEKCRSVN